MSKYRKKLTQYRIELKLNILKFVKVYSDDGWSLKKIFFWIHAINYFGILARLANSRSVTFALILFHAIPRFFQSPRQRLHFTKTFDGASR